MASTEIDWKVINTIRVLAADTVEKAKSGHPGAPMGCAPMAHVLWSKFMRHNPANPKWINRDRFVLSNGHGCALLYSLLHLYGYGVSLEDLKRFRQIGSITPGHPESHMTPGIEVTTGPLGQGIAQAVGLAAAEAHLAASFNKPGFDLFDNYTYAITGDGCLQEGVASEAASLAGHLQLGKLIVLYDDNGITIDGETDVSFTEDVLKRFEAYGWHTQYVDDGDKDISKIITAVETAKQIKNKPSLIKIKTTIGFGSAKQGTEGVHGAPLGASDLAGVKRAFGFDPEQSFVVPSEVKDFFLHFKANGAELESKWNSSFVEYSKAYPELATEISRRLESKLPDGWKNALPRYTASDADQATRKLSQILLNKVAPIMPELIGGSADLTGSNLTKWDHSIDFQPDSLKDGHLGHYYGRYFRFGVREHGMFAFCNGLASYGMIIPFGATFLNFISYGLGAVRLSALSHLRVIYIMTHDSIGLGEDGPTHQPIETLAGLRATPNIAVYRPADGNEVSAAYQVAIESQHRPTVIALSRQNVPQLHGSSIEKAALGGYVLEDSDSPQIILVGTGTETSLAVDAAKLLRKDGLHVRVVSMPCGEVFNEQPQEYKESVFPDGVVSISIEAMSTIGWQRYSHAQIGLDSFGASGPYKDVYKHFGLVPEVVAEKSKKAFLFFGTNVVSPVKKPF